MPRSVRLQSLLFPAAVLVFAGCGPGPEMSGIDLTRHPVTLSEDPRLTRAVDDNGGTAAGHSTSGKVLGSSGPGVTLSLTGNAQSSTVTDSAGHFQFDGLADGTYQVTPDKDGFRFMPASVVVTVNGSNVEEQNFVAFPVAIAHGISGTILHAPGLTITVGLVGPSLTTQVDASDSGTFDFEGLPDAAYRITPLLDGYTFTPDHLDVGVNGADVTGLEFDVEPQ